ncbi:MAG: SDR family NAD(P)-dependent oxidoreductase, partial [Alistipes sp.]|nr:SDR family NAD(P)-dependent oxidoreductase [Alistipes sp.]
MKLLENKVALVTGAARGIGKAIALELAKNGADIAFTDLNRNEVMEATEAEIAALGVKCKGYASNAADFAETHTVVEQILADFGKIDVLVNNAGITKDGLMMRMSEEQWDAVLTVNLKSAFNFIHACVPSMARQRSGSIINISSVVGVSGNAGLFTSMDDLALLLQMICARGALPDGTRYLSKASVRLMLEPQAAG